MEIKDIGGASRDAKVIIFLWSFAKFEYQMSREKNGLNEKSRVWGYARVQITNVKKVKQSEITKTTDFPKGGRP